MNIKPTPIDRDNTSQIYSHDDVKQMRDRINTTFKQLHDFSDPIDKRGISDIKYYLLPNIEKKGYQAKDHEFIVGEKNEIYLDIYRVNKPALVSFSFLFPQILILFFLFIFGYNTEHNLNLDVIDQMVTWITLPNLLFVIVLFLWPSSSPVMRLNRQRQEVYVRVAKKQYQCIAWQQLAAIYVSGDIGILGPLGEPKLATTGWLRIYIIDKASGKIRPEPIMHIQETFPQDAIEQWECIRAFMQESPQACPDSRLGKNFWHASGLATLSSLAKESGLLVKIILVGFNILIGGMVYGFLLNLKQKKLPTFTEPAIIEWSKPYNVD